MTSTKKVFDVVSLFSGCGGMDLGIEGTGRCRVIWANDNNRYVHPTYQHNFPDATLDGRSITEIHVDDIPACDGIVGGPPCQPFSALGKNRGTTDPRGLLFKEFVRIVSAKRPTFIIFENVPRLALSRHKSTLDLIVNDFESLGYNVHVKVLHANEYGVAQSRQRMFLVGIRSDTDKRKFVFPAPQTGPTATLRSAIFDLGDSAIESIRYKTNNPAINAHEHIPLEVVGLSAYFMRAQHMRSWDETSYTIPASVASLPFHPSAPKLLKICKVPDCIARAEQISTFGMVPGHTYRKFSARECARIQGFPDRFLFKYKSVRKVHRMIGNAVPPPLAAAVIKSIVAAIDV